MNCQFCGYDIKKTSGCLGTETRYKGRMTHKGCLENYLTKTTTTKKEFEKVKHNGI